jgi:hypothetical protein
MRDKQKLRWSAQFHGCQFAPYLLTQAARRPYQHLLRHRSPSSDFPWPQTPGSRVAAPGDNATTKRTTTSTTISSRSSTVPQQHSSHNNQVLLQRRRGSTRRCPTRRVPTKHADLPSHVGRRGVRDKTATPETTRSTKPSRYRPRRTTFRLATTSQSSSSSDAMPRAAVPPPSTYAFVVFARERSPKAKYACAETRWWYNTLPLGPSRAQGF